MGQAATRVRANDFTRQWDDVRDDALEAVDRVGRSGQLILGEEVGAFEKEFADWWGVPHAVGVASGLDALEIALRATGVPAGSQVITTPLTAFATTLAIIRAGAKPVWCDVDESGGLDLDQVESALQDDPSIKAVLPVHLYGHPLDPARLEHIAEMHEVVVIEDCAQSAGAERLGRATATAGIAAGTSLYPTKNLGAMGDGGVLLTRDATVAERARVLRNYGQRRGGEYAEVGLNSRLDELHAAILRTALLPRLNGWLERRKTIAAGYTNALADSALRPITATGQSAHHLFPVEVKDGDRDTIAHLFAERGISVGRHYPFVCSSQEAAREGSAVRGSQLVAQRIAERELSLPIHPYLTDHEVDEVIQACLDVCG